MFEIIKTINDDPITARFVDSIEKERDALSLARMYADDHYGRAGVDNQSLRETHYGASFKTNNGTPVSYTYRLAKGPS